MSAPGRLYGVGLGPGDPELVTVKAARLIGAADVVAYHQGPRRRSHARRIAAPYLPDGVVEELLEYPVTTGGTDHPGGYAGAMTEFYERRATRIVEAAEATLGLLVEVIAQGQAEGKLQPGDPQQVGIVLFATLQGIASIVNGNIVQPELLDGLVTTAVDQFLRGARP